MVTVRVDDKGRLSIPAEIRTAMGIKSGDLFFLESDPESEIIHLAKAVNPFDGLAEHALREYRAGRTRNLREYAIANGFDLNGE
ncbi:MAG: AbrB/MazE/SpoVT family DNA-binding domain-containing protein [Chloroflexota bacterium]|nr:AbrB/MazE/SpoVT family DNA-binding domain-containing protein [Chloroflexota bacterium]